MRLEGQIAALTADPAFNGGDYTAPPRKGIEAFGMVWAGWLYSQEWWRRELWKTTPRPTRRSTQVDRELPPDVHPEPTRTISFCRCARGSGTTSATTPGFDGDVEKALASITVPLLYMPSETDLYFPVGDARYEAQFIPHVTLDADPVALGTPGRRRRQPRRSRLPQRSTSPVFSRFRSLGGQSQSAD